MGKDESVEEAASISGGRTPEQIGEFWDTHDFTDYEDICPDVTDQFEISIEAVQHLVAIDPDVLAEASALARRKGISVQTLINLAVRQAVAGGR